ncbi:hypothetical protein Tco_1121548 [Tanacetum coccineum]|uniref:Retrovirus-related Pol polyprotein from transposon TNT 1-94 n=1 Tax=Tanacetum coccineum TaxID=301880 RepID=A0ABQ5J0Y9_9ASTR
MDKKSTSSACQILGGKLICKSAKKQLLVAMSSAKVEYVAAAGCCASILWMKSQLSDYDIHYKMVPIFYDNTSAISISNNPVIHSRTKHIDIRCGDPNHLIGECSKPSKNNDQRAFIGGAWSDNGEYDVEKTKDETCLVAQAPDEICLGINL